VAVLLDGPAQAGAQSVRWDLRSSNGTSVPAGIYLYELRAAGERVARRMVVLK